MSVTNCVEPGTENDPLKPGFMFFVYRFLADDFHLSGAFSVFDEAMKFATEIQQSAKNVWIIRNEFADALEQQLATRLGELAKILMPDKDLPDPIEEMERFGVKLDECQVFNVRSLLRRHRGANFLAKRSDVERDAPRD